MIEKIADLIHAKKLPLLDDVRDESAEDIRLVLVPKNRNVEDSLLMEALFRHTDLESRFSLNMNILDGGLRPGVMNIKQVLQAWLDHQQEVLVRRSQHRLEKVLHRLEILEGYLTVYLNIDEVIRIIRFEDEPKANLISTFGLSDVQAEAVLNLRLRRLHKLEEMEIRGEHDTLAKERDGLEKLIKSEARQWTKIKKHLGEIRKRFGQETALGARRTEIGSVPKPVSLDVLDEALIEKEPITVICSSKGWIKALKGHGHNEKDFKYKDGDRGQFVLECQTTDKIIVFATNGRFYTIGGDKLPSGRGYGEPLRLMVDLPNDSDIVDFKIFEAGERFIIASTTGHGFIVKSDDVLAQTKSGKQVLNVSANAEAKICRRISEGDDMIATIGSNRKLLIFGLEELPEMSRGKGVILQKFKDGQLSDIKTFTRSVGLEYKYASGTTVLQETVPWEGKRSQAGKLPPNGFPKNNTFV